jgi:hypothetical protein
MPNALSIHMWAASVMISKLRLISIHYLSDSESVGFILGTIQRISVKYISEVCTKTFQAKLIAVRMSVINTS